MFRMLCISEAARREGQHVFRVAWHRKYKECVELFSAIKAMELPGMGGMEKDLLDTAVWSDCERIAMFRVQSRL